jgi:long-subunit acyl-CoA synthetase (AMP-forming)
VFSYRDNKIVKDRRRGVFATLAGVDAWEDWAVAPNAAAGADTFPKLLIRNAQLYGLRPAMRHKDLGIWQSWTWREVLEIVRAYAVGLHNLGVKRGETIAIVAATDRDFIGR